MFSIKSIFYVTNLRKDVVSQSITVDIHLLSYLVTFVPVRQSTFAFCYSKCRNRVTVLLLENGLTLKCVTGFFQVFFT